MIPGLYRLRRLRAPSTFTFTAATEKGSPPALRALPGKHSETWPELHLPKAFALNATHMAAGTLGTDQPIWVVI
jgi:hypothetical protein